MKIYLGTQSALKLQAVETILQSFLDKKLIPSYQLHTEETDSLVPPTPHNNETYQGARNRAQELYKKHKTEGNLFIGVESGLVKRNNIMFEECWCCVITNQNDQYFGYSSGYELPKRVKDHLDKGGKHVDIMDQLETELNISKKDTWALYTKNIISRKESIAEAIRNAFSSYLIAQAL